MSLTKLVYSKEYIADNKVMVRNVYEDGTIKNEYVRDIDFKDTKKFPNLIIKPVVKASMPIQPVEVVKNEIKIENTNDVKKAIELPKQEEKKEDDSDKKKKKSKKIEEVILPKEEDLLTE